MRIFDIRVGEAVLAIHMLVPSNANAVGPPSTTSAMLTPTPVVGSILLTFSEILLVTQMSVPSNATP